MNLPKPESREEYAIYAIVTAFGLAVWGIVQIATRKE